MMLLTAIAIISNLAYDCERLIPLMIVSSFVLLELKSKKVLNG